VRENLNTRQKGRKMKNSTFFSSETENQLRNVLNSCSVQELRRLKIEMMDGKLCLIGTLSTWYHKQLAQELLRRKSPIPVLNLTSVESFS